jgi:protein-S-isoprenylcysteine O-methyltransferase Ste14
MPFLFKAITFGVITLLLVYVSRRPLRSFRAHGLYRNIRHPMYNSLLCLALGVFFKSPSWIGFILALGAGLFLILTAKVEGAENRRYFEGTCQAYQKRTKMFITYEF